MKRKAMSLIGLLLMVAVSTVEYTGGKRAPSLSTTAAR